MQLYVLDQTFEYTNDLNSIDDCFEKINQLISESNFVLSHLEVDGVDVYEDHHEYISTHLAEVHNIFVRVTTFKQILNEVVLDLYSYLDRAIPETKQLADDFYKSPDKNAWDRLTKLLEGLQWIMQAIQPIYALKDNNLPFSNSLVYGAISLELTDQFKDLENALNNTDLVLVGDILKYEVIERLDKLKSELQITIDNEVTRHDLN